MEENHSIASYNIHQRIKEIISSNVDVRKLVSTIIFTLYLGLTLMRFLVPANVPLTTAVILLGLVALIFASMKINSDNIAIYLLASLLIISFLVSSVVVSRDERIIHVVIFIIFNSGISLLLLKEKFYTFGPYLVFYGLCFFFLKLIVEGTDPLYALEVTSGNGISMMIIVACISLYIATVNEKNKLDIYPAIFTFLICIWSASRAGILSSLIILLGVVYIKYPRIFKLKNMILLICVIFVPLIYYFEEALLYLSNYSFFEGAVSRYYGRSADGPEPRLEIWGNYFNNLDLARVFFGANVLTDPWPDKELYAYNYHNTFIQLHSQTGLIGLGFICFIIFSYFKLLKINIIFFFLLVGITSRAFTDGMLFFESWDFIIYYLVAFTMSKYLTRIKLK